MPPVRFVRAAQVFSAPRLPGLRSVKSESFGRVQDGNAFRA